MNRSWIVNFDPKTLLFSTKVKEACKSCKRYGKKPNCPPYTESIEYYHRLLSKYKRAFLIVHQESIEDKNDWETLGRESSKRMAEHLSELRQQLIDKGHYFIVCFGAGSCKNCKNCTIPCTHPDKAFMPVEATGVDVVKFCQVLSITLKEEEKINITFPVKDTFYRIGMVIYD
jgi:predicted metal-binding protein